MKKLLYILISLAIPVLSYGRSVQDVEKKPIPTRFECLYEYAWSLERNGNHIGALCVVEKELKSNDYSPVQFLHLLMAKSVFCVSLKMWDEHHKCMEEAKNLRVLFPECELEYRRSYWD